MKCAEYGNAFGEKKGVNIIVPSVTSPVYVCTGRNKFKCRHSYYYKCFHNKIIRTDLKGTHRRSSQNNNKNK